MTKIKLTKEEIIQAIRHTADTLGHSPSRSNFVSITGISEYKVLKHFASWNDAVKEAGLKPNLTNVKISDGDLIEDWALLVRKLREIPTRSQYQRFGNYSSGVFEKHFGPWSSIPDKFREFASGDQEWSDVIALLPVEDPFYKASSRSQIIEKDQFVLYRSKKRKRHPKLNDRPTYGDPIDFRGLRHEPVNESGVVFLFGMVARELGYMVEVVQEGYPDCEAKRQIDKGKGLKSSLNMKVEIFVTMDTRLKSVT